MRYTVRMSMEGGQRIFALCYGTCVVFLTSDARLVKDVQRRLNLGLAWRELT